MQRINKKKSFSFSNYDLNFHFTFKRYQTDGTYFKFNLNNIHIKIFERVKTFFPIIVLLINIDKLVYYQTPRSISAFFNWLITVFQILLHGVIFKLISCFFNTCGNTVLSDAVALVTCTLGLVFPQDPILITTMILTVPS